MTLSVLHLSSYDVRGGAARAAHRLHRGLIQYGQDSRMLVARRYGADATTVREAPLRRGPLGGVVLRTRRTRLRRAFGPYRGTRGAGHELFSQDGSIYGADLPRSLPRVDIVNLHWVAGFVDVAPFFRHLASHIPVVWTCHDMNPFTGGCHYDEDCGKFARACGACPQLGSRRERDLSRGVWERKRSALAGLGERPLRIVADSHWLAGEARASSLFRELPVDTIHYGLDLATFKPRDRGYARSVVGIPADARVVLFVADSVTNRRKGMRFLMESLGRLNSSHQAYLVSLGAGEPAVPADLPHRHLGAIDDDRMLSLVYTASDVFVIPSVQEAFGQTALESIACGTPVVGFAAGGIPDVVRPDQTGVLVPVGDVRALADAIEGLLADSGRRAILGRTGRRIAEAEFSLGLQARRYTELYESMLSGRQR